MFDAGLGVCIGGADRHLPAKPGARGHALFLQADRQQARRDLFAGRNHDVVFTRVVHRMGVTGQCDKVVGHARHGGDDNGNFVPGVVFALHPRGDGLDSVEIGDGRAAKFGNDATHGLFHCAPGPE